MVESGGSIELVAGDGDTGTGGHMLLSAGLSSASSGAGGEMRIVAGTITPEPMGEGAKIKF